MDQLEFLARPLVVFLFFFFPFKFFLSGRLFVVWSPLKLALKLKLAWMRRFGGVSFSVQRKTLDDEGAAAEKKEAHPTFSSCAVSTLPVKPTARHAATHQPTTYF
ncbi:hypothetical protein TRV_08028 [Trichophyton verrucosum HKI 0517]|uniref:Uncharacterized protein n=1 Tax=Trichophyton verrucosum (strain HKI 0517) TaxID=663202 RepID=D4DLF4_TRIVH|nr:uncharacterized protein TRV_08028 [Trichophyton verrucosum HKI 0517]EFE37332.1 hypothetical protein TRV_08028 [Trichophyton verrucosum HKI 0517]